MQLSKIQNSFKAHMFSTVESVENPREDFANLFDVGNIPLDTRLKIYRNHIVTTLSEVLVESFPLVEALTGKDFLKTAAKLYLFDNPPAQACLDYYGESFPTFLMEYKHARSLSYLPDVARLDWAMNEVRVAKDDATLQIESLVNIPPEFYETAIFNLKKSTRLIHSPYPLDQIYNFCTRNVGDEETLNLDSGGGYILVSRMEWEPMIFALDEVDYKFLLMVKENKPLGVVLKEILKTYSDFNFEKFLQNYIHREIFSSIITN